MAVRVIVLLGLALIIGVATVIFAKKWIDGVRQPPTTAQPAEPRVIQPERFVLVARRNLQPGMLIGPDSVRWQGWPTDDLPPSYIVQGEREETEFFGAVVRYQIAVGEPMSDMKVAKPGEQGFLAAVLTPGMRAVTVAISDTRASGGFILPGDRVDVVLTHQAGIGMVSETVFLDMRVLAIDQNLSSPEGAAKVGRTATLEVTPREVEAFSLMQQMGTVSLSLRSLQPGGPQGKPNGQTDLLADGSMAEKPETIDKVPTEYPGETTDEITESLSGEDSRTAVGQTLGELEMADDEHSARRRDQTFTAGRDVSVLLGGGAGGGGGSVVVIRGNAAH